MYVKDYKGSLIEKAKARKIQNELGGFDYYEVNVSCIKMPNGKWYRTTTGKIIFDHSIGQWIFSEGFKGHKGLVAGGIIGYYSDFSNEVTVSSKTSATANKKVFNIVTKELSDIPTKDYKWSKQLCINSKIAIELGYKESIYDGTFYRQEDCNREELDRMTVPHIPQSERHSIYSLDDDTDYRGHLEACYENNKLKIDPTLKKLARNYIPFSFGCEIEIQDGHVPKRVREPLGFRTCRDGSLDVGGGIMGQEYVSVPMEGGKGLQVLKEMCDELTKRCVISNKCSVHFHFGDVRRDRLYVLSLWNLLRKIQDEFKLYFPYSRTNSIREDGKVYASFIPDVKLKLDDILGSKSDEEFKKRVTEEFVKVYTWLNSGHPPGESFDKQFVKDTKESLIEGKTTKKYCYRVKTFNFTTKLPRHAIQGQKWLRPQRYLLCNFLNFFFAHSKTIELSAAPSYSNVCRIMR